MFAVFKKKHKPKPFIMLSELEDCKSLACCFTCWSWQFVLKNSPTTLALVCPQVNVPDSKFTLPTASPGDSSASSLLDSGI